MKVLLKKTFCISILLILVVFGVAFGNVNTHIVGEGDIEMNNETVPTELLCTMDNSNDLWYDDSYDMINKSTVNLGY